MLPVTRLAAAATLAIPLAAVHCEGAPFSAQTSDGGAEDDGATTDAPASDALGEAGDAAVRFNTPVTLASSETDPRGIAVDDLRLFWADAETSSGGAGSIRSILKTGMGPVTTIAESQPSPLDVILDSSGVYWSINTGGNAPTTPQCLVMTENDNGNPRCVVSAPYATSRITLTTNDVVILAAGAPGQPPQIGYAPKAGGGAYMSAAAQGASSAVVSTDTTAFLGNANGPHVDALALSGLTFLPNACTQGCGTGTVVDLALDTGLGRLYWATTMGQVVSAPVVPTTANGTTLATLTGTPTRVARDATYVYVALQPSSIVAIPTAGGAPIVLAANESSPFGITVDAVNVYWTCGNGAIRAVGIPR